VQKETPTNVTLPSFDLQSEIVNSGTSKRVRDSIFTGGGYVASLILGLKLEALVTVFVV
jgi:hypothetical protein